MKIINLVTNIDLMNRAALVMSGGGARGAYQAGVIKALEEILRPIGKFPFDIICGASAGSINAGGLANYADNFKHAAEFLERLWGGLTADKVIRSDLGSLSRVGARWIRDLSFGGAIGGGHARSLLETDPLRDLLTLNYDPEKTRINIENKHFYAAVISATNIYTNNSVAFVQGHPNLQLWSRHKRVSELTNIQVDHLMASSAIPIFFPSVQIEGRHFTDGCIGNIAPLSPAVHLGANRIIAIGVRNIEMDSEQYQGPRETPSMAHLIGILMNTVFMDAIESDIARMRRINEIMSLGQTLEGNTAHWQPIEVLQISPSERISEIARDYIRNLPRIVRYLMKGLGDQGSINDVASYLLFDSNFCSRLIELGYNDALKMRKGVEIMFS